jgi:SAM-dependent methyltransferase
MATSLLTLLVLLCLSRALAQKPEYEFFTDFRNVFTPKVRAETPGITADEIIERYRRRLRGEQVPEAEIARRVRLIRTQRHALEVDMWNRVYTKVDREAEFNQAPNAFLMEMMDGRPPGVALDYAMGEGRNSIYLARLGWEVWGFDQADAAIAAAQKRAKELGLRLNTATVRDSEYRFGKERFDLILFSWSMPLVPVQQVVDALKPGGTVVMECAANYVGRNEMLKMFDTLQIIRYEIVRAKADWYNRIETDVLRMVAVKAKYPTTVPALVRQTVAGTCEYPSHAKCSFI